MKGFEDSLMFAAVDPDAVVLHHDHMFIVVFFDIDLDARRGVWTHVGQGIADQIRKDFIQLGAIALNHRWERREDEVDSLLLEAWFHFGLDLQQDVPWVDGLRRRVALVAGRKLE